VEKEYILDTSNSKGYDLHMAKFYTNPNPYSNTLDKKYLKYILYLVSITLGMALAFLVSKNLSWGAAIIGCCALFFFIKMSDFITRQMNKNYRGAGGEREVATILKTLPDDFVVFQNVLIGRHLDIDLVVLGPTGVYAIEVKSHRKYKTSEFGKDFIAQTFNEAMGLKACLKRSGIDQYVNAVLVFSRAFVPYNLPQSNSVTILPKISLLDQIIHGRRVIFDRTKAEQAIKNLYR